MDVHEVVLPPEPSSARLSRRLAVEALRAHAAQELIDDVALLVNELVTNALLHAGSEISLRLRVDDGFVRVEVQDASPVIPAVRPHGEDASTGRGLEMVTLLATRWGVRPELSGKTVWFEVGHKEAGASHTGGSTPGMAMDQGVRVHLVDVPVRLYQAVQQHNDALLREHALLAFAGGASSVSLHLELMATVHVQIERELSLGAATGSAQIRVSPHAREHVAALLAALNTADELSRSGALLTPPALPEVRSCRLWLFREIVAQLDGNPPTPWSDEQVSGEAVAGLPAQFEHTLLDQLTEAIVVADSDNRIVHANPAAEQLLGWAPSELIGRRVTTIIPERLREAHVAGFTRYLLTGEARLMGRPIRVPARRRDGSDVQVELVLSPLRGSGGEQLFAGAMRSRAPEVERPDPLRVAVEGMRAATAALTVARPGTVHNAAADVLPALGRALRARFAALWEFDEDSGALRCTRDWQDAEKPCPEFAATTATQRLGPGVGLPGRVWQSAAPVVIPDLVADANFPRLGVALQHGLRSALAFPVVRRSGVVGVIELFADELTELDEDVLAVMCTVGQVLGGHTES